jgi:hypothetical protein
VARIELCRTTAAELRQSFGEPMRDGRVRDGRVASWMLGRGHPERILAVLLDSHGVVVDIYWDVPGVGSWAPRDACRAGGGPGSPPTP